MKMPNVQNVVRIEELNVTINFLAYRQMEQHEMRRASAVFRRSKQGRRLKKNSTYTITTIYGAMDY